jgi:plasmid stabilization system protein ParE
MVKKVFITDYAKMQLKSIYNYYKNRVSIETAKQINVKILSEIKYLAKNPLMFQIEEDLAELNLSHRRIVADNYKIIYRFEAEIVYITDIFDTRQNPDKIKG